MRGISIALTVAAGIGLFGISSGLGAPVDGSAILRSLESTSPIQEARVFCYNRYTGRFLHWGSCRPSYHVHYRVYCKNRYTGQFLYWGSCRR
jgi:hypothetical protein